MRNRSLARLFCLGLLVGVACSITMDGDSPQLHFGWLSGFWKGTPDAEVRLVWNQPTADGISGVAQDRRGYSAWAIERGAGRYRLCVKDFGQGLAARDDRRGARTFELIEEGRNWARFACIDKGCPRIIEFQYCSYRTSSAVLQVHMTGTGPDRNERHTFLYESPSS